MVDQGLRYFNEGNGPAYLDFSPLEDQGERWIE